MEERNKGILRYIMPGAVLVWGLIFWLTAAADRPGAPAEVRDYTLYGGFVYVDLNTATFEELMALPEISDKLAGRIVDYRELLGGYERPEQLLDIYGIGEITLERVRPYIVIRSDP